MGIARGPNIIKDNLVFGYDTGYGVADNNTATIFYPGENTVNILPSGPATGTGDFSRQAAHNESFTYSKITNYRGRADVHKLYINPTGNTADPYADFGGQYHKSGGSAVGDVYALSFDFYVAKGNNPPGLSTSYVNGYKSPTNAGAASFSANNDVDLGDGWTRRTRIATIITAGNTWWRFGCNTNGNETEVYIDNVQIELKSHATPFVDGTRSSTQSLIDLKRTTDIDVTNVSFDSTGQPTFDETDDHITGTLPMDGLGAPHTVEMVFSSNVNQGSIGSRKDPFSIGNSSNGQYSALDVNTTYMNWYFYNQDVTFTNNPTMVANKFYHIVLSYAGGASNNTNKKVWINGIQQSLSTGSSLTSALPDNPNFSVGRDRGRNTAYWPGEIPVWKVYQKAFTQEEAQQNYNAYKKRFNI